MRRADRADFMTVARRFHYHFLKKAEAQNEKSRGTLTGLAWTALR
jgi:hypothetical protein